MLVVLAQLTEGRETTRHRKVYKMAALFTAKCKIIGQTISTRGYKVTLFKPVVILSQILLIKKTASAVQTIHIRNEDLTTVEKYMVGIEERQPSQAE